MRNKYRDELLEMPTSFHLGKIGVVTVLYNSAEVLPEFFSSIEQQQMQNFLVYCIDNASTDNSVEQCKGRDSRYIVHENGENLGVSRGNNIGIKMAVADGCEFVLLLNNDVVFGSALFGDLVDGLAEFNCSMTTPRLYYHGRPEIIWASGGYFQPWLGYRALHHGQNKRDEPTLCPPHRVTYTPTCCVLIKREVFAQIGLMDERFFAYWDDTDFMLRAWRSDLKLFCLPQARLWHKVSSLTGVDSPFSIKFTTRNHALFNHKNVTAVAAWAITLLYAAYYIALWVARRMTREESLQRLRYWQEGVQIAHIGARNA